MNRQGAIFLTAALLLSCLASEVPSADAQAVRRTYEGRASHEAGPAPVEVTLKEFVRGATIGDDLEVTFKVTNLGREAVSFPTSNRVELRAKGLAADNRCVVSVETPSVGAEKPIALGFFVLAASSEDTSSFARLGPGESAEVTVLTKLDSAGQRQRARAELRAPADLPVVVRLSFIAGGSTTRAYQPAVSGAVNLRVEPDR